MIAMRLTNRSLLTLPTASLVAVTNYAASIAGQYWRDARNFESATDTASITPYVPPSMPKGVFAYVGIEANVVILAASAS